MTPFRRAVRPMPPPRRSKTRREPRSTARAGQASRPISFSSAPAQQHSASCQKLRRVDELAYHKLELSGGTRILESVPLVKSLLGIRHRHLLGDDQRPATHRQNLAQRQQRMRLVFLINGVIEALYSGLAMNTP